MTVSCVLQLNLRFLDIRRRRRTNERRCVQRRVSRRKVSWTCLLSPFLNFSLPLFIFTFNGMKKRRKRSLFYLNKIQMIRLRICSVAATTLSALNGFQFNGPPRRLQRSKWSKRACHNKSNNGFVMNRLILFLYNSHETNHRTHSHRPINMVWLLSDIVISRNKFVIKC